MATVRVVQDDWSGGMVRDFPRDKMPVGTCWNAVDLILNYGAPLRARGAWRQQSSDVSVVNTRVIGGVFAVFSTSAGGDSPKNLAIDSGGLLYDVTSSPKVDIGTAVTVAQNPVFHGGTAASAATAVYTGLVVIPDGTGAAVPKKYDGTTLSDLNGAPPKARFACVYKDYTLLGNGTVGSTYYPNRTWFSPPGDPDCGFSGSVTAWDTTDSWLDVQQAVRGYGATKNALLIFGDSQISRVRGSVPPPDTDMVIDDPLFDVGLLDPFSISTSQETVHWCAPEGVFRSDGVALDDLTRKGGMLSYWLDLVSDATSTWTFATGIIRDHLMICVLDGSTFKDCLMVDLRSYAWTRHSNFDAITFWPGLLNQADECYFGRREEGVVGRLEPIFSGASEATSDDNGSYSSPVLETPFYTLGPPGLKRIKSAYFTYSLSEVSEESVTLYYATSPDKAYVTGTAFGSQAAGSNIVRVRHPLGVQSPGIALKLVQVSNLAQADARSDLSLYDISFDGHALEQSRLAQ